MDTILLGIVVIALLLLAVTLHEAMHAYVSYWLGDDTALHSGRLTLNPIAHIDPFMSLILPIALWFLGLPIFGGAKPVPFNPYRLRYGDWGQAIVAVAGPLTNLVLAVITGVWLRFIDFPNEGFVTVLELFVQINLGFFVFNLIPIPPLDGSRVLYAVVPESFKATLRNIEQNGLLVIFAVVLIFSSTISRGMLMIIRPLFELITGTPIGF